MPRTRPDAPRVDDPTPHPWRPRKRVLMLADLTGYTRFCERFDDADAAHLMHRWYERCHAVVAGAGGRVVKFLGDGCLASFPPGACVDAVDACEDLARAARDLGEEYGVDMRIGVNLHMATVLCGRFGPPEVADREDVIGAGVNATFLLGRGAGVRLSEPVYRALPSDRRGPWKKHRPPARYHLERRP